MATRLRSADQLLATAVSETLANLKLTPADAAVTKLARRYAEAIDAGGSVETLAALGPRLLATLDALGATPRARANARTPAAPAGGPSRLESFRAGA